jgi:hypothetical protein
MFPTQSLAPLLWRLRRESALYFLGAGASAPELPLTPALMRQAAGLRSLGRISCRTRKSNDFNRAHQRGRTRTHLLPGQSLRPGTTEFPSREILLRLSNNAAIASFMHYLSTPRLNGDASQTSLCFALSVNRSS